MRRNKGATVAFNAVGLVFALVMVFPVYWMLATAFKPANEVQTFSPQLVPLHPTLDNFRSVWHAPNFLIDLRNSLIITLSSVAIGVVVGFLGALAIARFRFYGRRAMILVILMVQMIPFTHELLSQYVGTSREIVTHYMNQFRRQGYLRYSRKGIILYRDAFREWLRQNA